MEAPNETTEDIMDEQLDIDDILSLASEPNDDLLDILLGDDSDDEDDDDGDNDSNSDIDDEKDEIILDNDYSNVHEEEKEDLENKKV